MSGRTFRNPEFLQWSYVALVGIALAFTTMTRAAAGTKPSDYGSELRAASKWDACLVHSVGQVPEKKMCEAKGDFTKRVPENRLFGSALVNTGSDSDQGGSRWLSPLRERRAD